MEDKNALLAKKILDSSTLVSIISIDIDGKINSFNKGAELMLGYEASELIGIETPVIIHDKEEIESYSKFLSSKYGEKIDGLDVFIYLAKLNGSDEREWTYIKKNGDRFTVRLSVTAIKDDETIIGYLGIAKDITEQNSTKNLILNIIDSIPSLIIGIDSNLLITQWNKKAWDITGKQAYEVIGKNIFDIYPPIETMKESIIGSIYSQISFNRKRVQIAMNGALDYYDFAVSPIIYNGSEGCVLRIDIVTEQVKLEERIIQSEKMMSITGLAAGMAHEINNPLAGIIQNAQNIERRLFEPSSKNIEVASQVGVNFEKIQEYLKNRSIERMVNGITVSGLKAAKIIKNIQSFSKKSSINFISINICELLETTLNLAKESFNTTNSYDFSKIKLVKDSDLNCPPLICDTNKLQQALFNIITNCAEAMVDIENPTLTIRVFRDGKWLIVEIEDNGHGMSEEVRKRVFEPFFTTKIVGKGPGLGLSIAYFIIADFHNGDLSLESDEGVGTKCIIRLPLIKE